MKLNEIAISSTEREQKLADTRERSLAHLGLEERRLFVKTLLGSMYDSSDLYKTVSLPRIADSFIKSIATQWITYGKMSEKQVAAVLRYADREAEKEVRAEMMPPITVGNREDFIGVVTEVFDYPTTDFNGNEITTNKILVKCRYGITVSFKTNRENLLKQMRELIRTGKKIILTSKVLWVSPKLDKVTVSSMGLRYKDYDEKQTTV